MSDPENTPGAAAPQPVQPTAKIQGVDKSPPPTAEQPQAQIGPPPAGGDDSQRRMMEQAQAQMQAIAARNAPHLQRMQAILQNPTDPLHPVLVDLMLDASAVVTEAIALVGAPYSPELVVQMQQLLVAPCWERPDQWASYHATSAPVAIRDRMARTRRSPGGAP